MKDLTDQQLLRYSRQIMLPQLDVAGQMRLAESRVLIAGVGGLGAPVALYLAAAGIGTLVLADADTVELSNLQRQIIHTQTRLGANKVDSAAQAIDALNSDVTLELHAVRLTPKNLPAIARDCDLVLDCSDNFATRFALNAYCVSGAMALVSGAAVGFDGQVSVFDSRSPDAPCYRCLYDEQGDQALSCAENGVLGPVVGIVGAMQALEAIKVLAGIGESLAGRLLIFDGLTSRWRELRLAQDPDCPVCSLRKKI